MVAIRKEQERGELHRAIWVIADGLRGSVDALTMLAGGTAGAWFAKAIASGKKK